MRLNVNSENILEISLHKYKYQDSYLNI